MSTVKYTTNQDLRRLFDHLLDANVTSSATVAADALGINTRYARELFGVLTNHDLAAEIDDEDGVVWIAVATNDEYHAVFPKTDAKPKPAKRANTASLATDANPDRKCLCRCGEPVGKRSNYRPGHDARHAGHVGRALADGVDLLDKLPTEALRNKARGIANKAKARESVKKPATVPDENMYTIGEVKVGRWTYPAQFHATKTLRNTKRDGSGEWVEHTD